MRRRARRTDPRIRRSRRSRRRLLLVFALIFAPAARSARAACIEFTSPPAITSSADHADAVAAADLDGDGDLDVISASSYDDKVAWYQNDGAGGGWTIHTIALDADGAASLAVADLDRDGDLDVLAAAPAASESRWYENVDQTTPGTGDGTSWSMHEISTAFDTTSVAAGDLDGDGDDDVLVGTGVFERVDWFANDGAGGGWSLMTVGTGANDVSMVAVADLDRDGDLDALAASKLDDEIVWYENLDLTTPGTGNGSSWGRTTIALTADYPTAIAFADFDRDGDIDVASASAFDSEMAWHENLPPGDGSTWTEHIVTTALTTAWGVFAGDVDGDGDPDLLGASRTDDAIAWYENDGVGGGWTAHTIATSADFALAVAAADLDGDGDLDALSASGNADQIAWYRNERLHDQALFAPTAAISTGVDGGFSVFAADVDGDGDTDALSASAYDDKIAWYENLPPGNGSSWTEHPISAGADGALSVFAADVDGDGDTDALSASLYDDKIAWYENLPPGNGSSWTEHPISASANFARSVFAADVDGDGDTDALSASFFDNKIAWYENLDLSTPGTGNGSSWTEHAISASADSAVWVFAADVDGDGDTDALSASANDNKIAWYENLPPGNGSSWTLHTISLGADGASSVFAADVDGGGDLDALSASRSDDKAAWYENDGTPVDGGWIEHLISTAGDYAISVIAADADGDGDLDALSISRNDDKVAWHENLSPGNGSSWTEHVISNAAGAAESVFAADVDGDGDLDALSALRVADTIAWYPNLGTGVFDDGFDSDANKACWSGSTP